LTTHPPTLHSSPPRRSSDLDIRPGRSPARFQKLHESLYFDVVFFFGAARKAWRETHFHFGIKAARESGVATDLDLTAPHFEQVRSEEHTSELQSRFDLVCRL